MKPFLRVLALAALAWLAPPALAQVVAGDQLERSWQVRSAPTLTVLRSASEPRPQAVRLMMPGGEGRSGFGRMPPWTRLPRGIRLPPYRGSWSTRS